MKDAEDRRQRKQTNQVVKKKSKPKHSNMSSRKPTSFSIGSSAKKVNNEYKVLPYSAGGESEPVNIETNAMSDMHASPE